MLHFSSAFVQKYNGMETPGLRFEKIVIKKERQIWWEKRIKKIHMNPVDSRMLKKI